MSFRIPGQPAVKEMTLGRTGSPGSRSIYNGKSVHNGASDMNYSPDLDCKNEDVAVPKQILSIGGRDFAVCNVRNSPNIDLIHPVDQTVDMPVAKGAQTNNYDELGNPRNVNAAMENSKAGTVMERFYHSEYPAKISASFVVSFSLFLLSVVVGIVGIVIIMTDIEINIDAYHIAMSIILLIEAVVGIIVIVRALENSQKMGILHRKRSVILFIAGGLAMLFFWISFSIWTQEYGTHLNHHNPKEFGRFAFVSLLGVLAASISSAFVGDAWISSKHPQYRAPDAVVLDKNGDVRALLTKQQIESLASSNTGEKLV